jgi:putative SOS response-associated peptidase YedK
MCGRFVCAAPPSQIAQYFDASQPETLPEPSYNVAPTNDVDAVVVVDGDGRRRRGRSRGPGTLAAMQPVGDG